MRKSTDMFEWVMGIVAVLLTGLIVNISRISVNNIKAFKVEHRMLLEHKADMDERNKAHDAYHANNTKEHIGIGESIGMLIASEKRQMSIEIRKMHSRYMKRGPIKADELENFRESCCAYYDLGGNGVVVKMEEEVCSLSIELE